MTIGLLHNGRAVQKDSIRTMVVRDSADMAPQLEVTGNLGDIALEDIFFAYFNKYEYGPFFAVTVKKVRVGNDTFTRVVCRDILGILMNEKLGDSVDATKPLTDLIRLESFQRFADLTVRGFGVDINTKRNDLSIPSDTNMLDVLTRYARRSGALVFAMGSEIVIGKMPELLDFLDYQLVTDKEVVEETLVADGVQTGRGAGLMKWRDATGITGVDERLIIKGLRDSFIADLPDDPANNTDFPEVQTTSFFNLPSYAEWSPGWLFGTQVGERRDAIVELRLRGLKANIRKLTIVGYESLEYWCREAVHEYNGTKTFTTLYLVNGPFFAGEATEKKTKASVTKYEDGKEKTT